MPQLIVDNLSKKDSQSSTHTTNAASGSTPVALAQPKTTSSDQEQVNNGKRVSKQFSNSKMKGSKLPRAPKSESGRKLRLVRQALEKLNPKRCCQKTKSLHEELKSPWDDMNYTENQNSIGTLDLFKYASLTERLAVGFGALFMWYAASWQPISVFILAIMAALMGQYSKQANFILQLNNQTLGLNLNLTFTPAPPTGELDAAGTTEAAPVVRARFLQ